MINQLQSLRQRLDPLKTALLNHPLYQEIDSPSALHLFMEHHVFAVWDFMSLLKALQKSLCCVEVPWLPAADSAATRLINEIVVAEESDADGRGGFGSHFELYHRAMTQCGANTAVIDNFLTALRHESSVSSALEAARVPGCVRQFVMETFRFIESGDLCCIASAFTFGREDLLPAIFQRIVDELDTRIGGRLEDFRYYLNRHIGLDGDEHGPGASRLLSSLCDSNTARWQTAEQAAVVSLKARKGLWDGICTAIRLRKNSEL